MTDVTNAAPAASTETAAGETTYKATLLVGSDYRAFGKVFVRDVPQTVTAKQKAHLETLIQNYTVEESEGVFENRAEPRFEITEGDAAPAGSSRKRVRR